jgi:hypothetical protein
MEKNDGFSRQTSLEDENGPQWSNTVSQRVVPHFPPHPDR